MVTELASALAALVLVRGRGGGRNERRWRLGWPVLVLVAPGLVRQALVEALLGRREVD